MSHVTEGSGGRDGAGESDGGRDTWTTVTSKKRAKYKPTKNRASDSESEDPLVKTFRITKDGKSITVTSIKDGKRVLYGKEGNKYCCICRAERDHLGASCPGFFCHKCHEYGHWAKVCTTKLKCSFCGDAEHSVEDCPKGGKSFSMATKRPSTDAAPAGPPKRVSAAAVAPPASVAGVGMSYSRALSRKSGETTGQSIGCFLDKFKGYGKQDFEAQLARLEKEAQDERARHERRMAELETRRREVLRNKRNADKLSSLLAQLKEVQDDMMGSSDEEFTPHVEAVESSVKSEKDSVDGSSSAVPCSAIVGGTTGSVATDIVGVSGTGSLDTLDISISDGRSSSVVPTNTIVGGGTGSAATDIVGVSGTRSYAIGNAIGNASGNKRLETAVSGDASDAALGGRSNVITRDIREFRNRAGSDSELEIRNLNAEMDWSKSDDEDNNK